MAFEVSEKTVLNLLGGVGGFIILTDSGSPHTIQEICVGAQTTDAGCLVSGVQVSDHPQATNLSGYEIDNSGNYDPIWCKNTVITVPGGATVKVILGK